MQTRAYTSWFWLIKQPTMGAVYTSITETVSWEKKSFWSLSTSHRNELSVLKRVPMSLHLNLHGVYSCMWMQQAWPAFYFRQTSTKQSVGLVFHSHLPPLWPLSSSCPLERDTHWNGLITRGVHFEEAHRGEMKGYSRKTVGGKYMWGDKMLCSGQGSREDFNRSCWHDYVA